MLMAVGVVVVVLLTAATGYFVAQEFAYVSVDRTRLRQLAAEGDLAAARALDITARLSFTLSGAQFGITVTALLVGYAGEPLIGTGLAELLGITGLSYAVRLSVAVLMVLVLSTILQMVIGELAPKNLAIARTVPLARALSRSTQAYLRVAGPVIRFFDSASNRLLRLFGIEPVAELVAGVTTEDLEHLIGQSRRGGVLEEDLSRLLVRGLGFRRLTAGQAMTPRVQVVTVGADAPVSDILVLLESSGRSRFPILSGDVDDVVGVVGLAEVLLVPRALRSTTTAGSIAAPPVLVPATLPLPGALETLRERHRQLAIVVDEYGGFDGVLSLEDIAEEVVGEILDEDDEYDVVRPDPAADGGVGGISGGGLTLSARLRLDEVEALTGIRLPATHNYDTVGGLVLERLGRIACVGDRIEVEEAPDPAVLADEGTAPGRIGVLVDAVHRHVPATVTLARIDASPTSSPFSAPADRGDA